MRLAPLTAVLALVVVGCVDGQSASEPNGSGTSPGSSGSSSAKPLPSGDGYEVCWQSEQSGDPGAVTFEDVTAGWGLEQQLTGMRGHAAAWGDVNGDGLVDLYVGTFATARTEVYQQRGAEGPSPDQMFLGTGDGFEPMGGFPEQMGRSSGAALVDLDGDGDLDLVISRNAGGRDDGAPTAVLENDGGFVEVESGIDPQLGGRSVGVLDIDGDGLLDLLILEDRYRGGSSRAYRNLGDLQFEDATAALGFPEDLHGLGLATSDLNNDGFTDVFVAGSNRLFVGTGQGVVEVTGVIGDWETYGPEDDVAGAAIADVNRDGWLDLLVGHHFNSTVDRDTEVPVRLYLNKTDAPGAEPSFDDVTAQVGLSGLPTKAPHVELADLDNDGWLDVLTSASADDGTSPAVFRNEGMTDGLPIFAAPEGLGSDQYWVSAPAADIDRDGSLDVLAVEWDPALPTILFSNTTNSGHWLEVATGDGYGGVGARIDVYEPGSAGDPGALIGSREITTTLGYTAGVELVAHFGLGHLDTVDLVVTQFGSEARTLSDVPADSRIVVGGNC